jgi:hypothetical protein
MALQKIDRQKAKHQIKTVKRVVPLLINRNNKLQRLELIPFQLSLATWWQHPKHYYNDLG